MIETCYDSTAAWSKQQAHETLGVFILIYLDFIIAIKIWSLSWYIPGGYLIYLLVTETYWTITSYVPCPWALNCSVV